MPGGGVQLARKKQILILIRGVFHLLDDAVAIILARGQDGENDRLCRGRLRVFDIIFGSVRDYLF
jgi:hypothetical protein